MAKATKSKKSRGSENLNRIDLANERQCRALRAKVVKLLCKAKINAKVQRGSWMTTIVVTEQKRGHQIEYTISID